MAGYHINGKGEVKPCRAEKGRCRFGGKSGVEGHHSQKASAEAEAQLRLKKRYAGSESGVQKQASPSFVKLQAAVKSTLVTYGEVQENSLKPVRTETDMVREWFGGDKNRYHAFKMLAEDSSMGAEAKAKVAAFINKGVAVRKSATLDDLSPKRAVSEDVSQVELLDENFKGLNLDAVRSGGGRAF